MENANPEGHENPKNLAYFLFNKITTINKEQNTTGAERIGAIYSLYRVFLDDSKDDLDRTEIIMKLRYLLKEAGMGLPDVFQKWYDDTIRDTKTTSWEEDDDIDDYYSLHETGERNILDSILMSKRRKESSSYSDEELEKINETAKLICNLAFNKEFIFWGFRFRAENILRTKFKEFREAFGKEKAKEMIKGVMGNVIKTVSFNIEISKKKLKPNRENLKRLRSILKTLQAILSDIALFWK